MHMNDWLTDERAQETIDKAQTIVNQEATRNVRSEAMKVICDTINTAH